MIVLLQKWDGSEVHSVEVDSASLSGFGAVRHEGVVYTFDGIYDRATLALFSEAQVLDTSLLS